MENQKMDIYKKIQEAKNKIKQNDLKKQGRNNHSKYDYFTPEQVEMLVSEACREVNLFNKYDLIRTELGLVAKMTVICLDKFSIVEYQLAMEIPSITATNVSQQIGGALTYSERYLLMTIYGIKDNNLDFDSSETPDKKEKPWLNPDTEEWNKAIDYLKGDGKITEIEKKYRIAAKNRETLISKGI